MLAFRLTLKVKPGCMDKAIKLAQTVKQVCPDWNGHVYNAHYGQWDTLIMEDAYESIADREAYWGKYSGKPEFKAWWEEWYAEVADSGSHLEIWNMIEI